MAKSRNAPIVRPLNQRPKKTIPPAPVSHPKRLLFSITAGILLCCLTGTRSSARPEHVILISCDGLRPDAVEFLGEKGAPYLHRLIKEGSYTHNARTDANYTVTLPLGQKRIGALKSMLFKIKKEMLKRRAKMYSKYW